jgi:hypothetical protein
VEVLIGLELSLPMLSAVVIFIGSMLLDAYALGCLGILALCTSTFLMLRATFMLLGNGFLYLVASYKELYKKLLKFL